MDGLLGGALLLGYLSLDGLTSTTQEKLFGRNPNPSKPFADGSPVLDQMFWTNLASSGISLIGCILAGSSTVASLKLMLLSPALLADVLLLSATAATGLVVLLNTIAAYGALMSSTIMTVRQFLSILIKCVAAWCKQSSCWSQCWSLWKLLLHRSSGLARRLLDRSWYVTSFGHDWA
jgi:hypothetical protein